MSKYLEDFPTRNLFDLKLRITLSLSLRNIRRIRSFSFYWFHKSDVRRFLPHVLIANEIPSEKFAFQFCNESFCFLKGMNWVPSSAQAGVPMNAVVAGADVDGAPIYVGRAYHEGDLVPAKVIPSKHVAYIPYNGQEVAKYDYHVRKLRRFETENR